MGVCTGPSIDVGDVAATRAEFARHALRQHARAGLADRETGVARAPAQGAGGAGGAGEDNRPAAALQHRRQNRTSDDEGTEAVDAPGILERVFDFAQQSVDRGFAAGIAGEGAGAAAVSDDGAHQRSQLFGVARGERHAHLRIWAVRR